MESATSDVRRYRSADVSPDRYEDPHIEPYVEVRKLSSEPSIREVTFPPNGRLDVHSHPNDTLYVIRSGEFHIEGEGVFQPGDVRWVRGGLTLRTRVGRPRGRRPPHRGPERTVRHHVRNLSPRGAAPARSVSQALWYRPPMTGIDDRVLDKRHLVEPEGR